MTIFRLIFAGLLTILTATAQAQVIHLFDDSGKLIGADNVVVNGLTYDVSFSGDTCITAFNGCGSNDEFMFHNADDALAASAALLEQVFVDMPGHALDSDPTLTKGISANPYNLGWIITPYEINGKGYSGLVLAQVLRNSTIEINDLAAPCDCGFWDWQELQATESYAIWTLDNSDVSSVPVPAALPLMFSGLAILGGLATRRKPSI